ncbi:MAG: CrcB family protein [Bacteroidetes bacterium]|nr:MAG: CrcB family protein [Bacteroidota bacterium]
MNLLFVFLGGGVGSVMRYIISVVTVKHCASQFPLATFVTNVLSCLVLALVVEGMNRSGYSENVTIRNLLLIGFCGGFSTFSTFSYETVQLIKSGNPWVAAGNIALSVGVCSILIYKLTK